MMIKSAIGIICREGQHRWVEEFFELFKTPWEFYRPDCTYPVVISTCGRPEDLRAQLLILYGSTPGGNRATDVPHGAGTSTYIDYQDTILPIYGKLFPFASAKAALARLHGDSTPVAIELATSPLNVIYAGYDLFEEVAFLLSYGQPVENAQIPTLDIHISML